MARYQNVCVIGSYLAQDMFRGDALGKTLTISGTPYTVVGVLASSPAQRKAAATMYSIFLMAMSFSGSMVPNVGLYLFTSAGQDSSSAAKGIIENRLYKAFQSSDYYYVMTSAGADGLP